MAPLSWRHHAMVQVLLSRGPLPEAEFHAVFAGVSGKDPAAHQKMFSDVLLRINKELAYVQFELRACRNQYDGKVYYGVVNNISDDESKLGTKYSVPQIAFYKGVLEAIVQDAESNGCITSIQALNVRLENQVPAVQNSQGSQSQIPAAFRNFSMTQKERTLNELIKDRWLSYTSTGKIGLGIRSFLDLRSWFRSNEIPSCEVCFEVGVKALTCPNEGCNVRIHDYCLKKKFLQQKGSRACPGGCGTQWPRSEGEYDEDENDPGESQVISASHPSRKRRRNVKAEAVEAANESQEHSAAMPRRSSRNVKAEAVEAANGRQQHCDAASRKSLRNCKAEAVEENAALEAASSIGSTQPIRSSKRRKT